jgi:hypothetical protein
VRVPPARPAEALAGIVQDAAVAHQGAARRVRDDLPERRHAVL